MRIRDRKTGEEVTLSFDDIKKGRLRFSARDKNGQMANMEIGGGEGKLPSWVPVYPGAKAQGNMTANGQGADGNGEGGMVSFTTPDSPSRVKAFYQEKCNEMGMSLDMSQLGGAAGMIIGASEDKKTSLQVMVTGDGSGDTAKQVGRRLRQSSFVIFQRLYSSF